MDSICKPPENCPSGANEALAEQITDALQALETLSLRHQDMQKSLQEFLEDYFVRVGPLLRARLQRQPTQSGDSLRHPARGDSSTAATETTFSREGGIHEGSVPISPPALRRELTRLYRHLAKEYHPDQGRQKDQEMMCLVNHAYAQRNLASLWKLSLGLTSPAPELLQEHLGIILTSLNTLKEAVQTLEASAEYQLMQRVFFARLNGYDLIRKIMQDLRRDLDHEARWQELGRATSYALSQPMGA